MAERPPTSLNAARGRGAMSWALALLAAGWLSAAHAEPAVSVAPAHGTGTIGLVIGDFHFALFQTPDGKQECPQGMQFKQMDEYNAEYATPEARAARERQFGYYTNRGPNGENIFYFPEAVKDPLPFRAAGGPTAIGMNLDGDLDGKGTAISFPHGKFTSPDGERGVDNQLYRVLGCSEGWRKGGGIEGVITLFLKTELSARVLLEITGVENEQNSPNVTVTIYRGADKVAVDSHNALIPWLSQRIDYTMGRRYIQRLRGRIEDGVLITEPADIRWPYFEKPQFAGDRILKKMRLRLKLSPDGAQGLMGGYADLDSWYLMHVKAWGAYKVADIEDWSGPGTYEALHKYADYRDPVTGQATAISSAYELSFARTFIIHTPQSDAAVAEALSGRKTPPAGAVASR
jgi:hypothetical protein